MTKAFSLFLAGFLSLIGPAALSRESRGLTETGFPGRDSAAVWQQLGPNGGEIKAVVSNPQNKSELWAMTGSNPALFFRSTDSGATWKRIAVAKEALQSFVAHPANGALYALGDMTIYKSTDHGVNWTAYSLGDKNYGWGGRIAAHPTNPNVLFVAGYHEQANGHRIMAFLKSADTGKTWTCQLLETSSLNGYLRALAVSPANPNILLASGHFTDSSLVTHYRIYKSLNGGKTWANKTGAISELVREIVAHPTNPNAFYAATDSNIWRTSNGAALWTKNNGYARGYCLTLDAARPAVLYAGSDAEVFRSSNGGLDWEESITGIFGSIYVITILPAKVLCGSSAGVFASAVGSGRDSWPSWTPASKGMRAALMRNIVVAPSSPNILYATLYTYGIFKSLNAGSTWQPLTGLYAAGCASRLAVHPSQSGVIYVMFDVWGADPFYRSKDGGKTWTLLMSDECRDFVLSPKNPDHIFIAGQTTSGSDTVMALHRSLDGGAHWSHPALSSAAGSCGYAVAVDPKDDAIVYLGGDSSGSAALFKSTNQGEGWANITGELTGRVVDIAIDPKNTSRVYVATLDGVWKSENGGASWTSSYGAGIGSLFIHPTATNIIYAAGYYGIFVSKNYGATWAAFDQGLTVKTNVVQLDINKATQTLFAACYGGSVCKRKL